MSDDDLTALVRSDGFPGTRRRWSCPDEERLVDYVEGRIPPGLREGVENHLSECDFCCGQVGFLARAEQLGPPPPVPAALLAGPSPERTWLPWGLRPVHVALAAGVGLALSLVVVAPRLREGPAPERSAPALWEAAVPAGPGTDRLVRNGPRAAESPWIVRPVEGESVAPGSLDLSWKETPQTLYYTVEIVDPKGDLVWEGRSDSTRLLVPAEAPLVPGRPYFVWVLAHLRSGAAVRSTAVGFRLAPG